MPNALFIVEVHLAVKLVHRHSTFNNLKETVEVKLTGEVPLNWSSGWGLEKSELPWQQNVL